MAKVYGIDLGTTYSAISTLDDNGNPIIIENIVDASPLLASAVYFQENGTPVVGKVAKEQAEIEPDRVIQFVKRQIGKPNAPSWEFNGEKYNPITISALILKRMKEYAESQGHEVKDVVITCPAYFGLEERNATQKAGEIAGLNVLNIVNEPTAAALNYFLNEFHESKKILVYDLGGGTFDVTLFDFNVDSSKNTNINIIDSKGDDHLGGVDWDNRLIGYIAEQYCNEFGVNSDDIDVELKQIIRNAAEETKIKLTQKTNYKASVNYDGNKFKCDVTREKFEELTVDLVEKTIDFIKQLLQSNSQSIDNVDVVLLVGGSTRMPMIEVAVEKMFSNKIRKGDPDKDVAKGAALAAVVALIEQKASSSGAIPDVLPVMPKGIKGIGEFKDKLSRSFGPAIINAQNEFVINNLLFIGDESPSEFSKTYGTMVDNQPEVQLYIFENVSTDEYTKPCINENDEEQYTDPALKVKKLGTLTLEMPPNTPKHSPIEVTFRCSTKGLEVIAKNPNTGKKVDTVIAFDSMSQQEFDEAKLRFVSTQTSGEIDQKLEGGNNGSKDWD